MYSESSASLSCDTDDATEERAFGKNTSSARDNLSFRSRSHDASLLGSRLSVTRGLRPPPSLAHDRGTHPSNWRVPPPGRPLARNRAPPPPPPPPPEERLAVLTATMIMIGKRFPERRIQPLLKAMIILVLDVEMLWVLAKPVGHLVA
jgi:hypothetical protein